MPCARNDSVCSFCFDSNSRNRRWWLESGAGGRGGGTEAGGGRGSPGVIRGLTNHGEECGFYSKYKERPLESAKLCRGTPGKMKDEKASWRDGLLGCLEEDFFQHNLLARGERMGMWGRR